MKSFEKFELPGVVTFNSGKGGLPKIDIETAVSTAEIYLHGAQITGFQKNGEPPLLFVSRLSQFASGKAIRGGVPICFPWFGPREGESLMHGFARITEWELISSAEKNGEVKLRFGLPEASDSSPWSPLRSEFLVTVSDTLTMELITTNTAADRNLEFENCLHTYFAVGDIRDVSITGLKSAQYVDKADKGILKHETAEAIVVTQETNRTYLDETSAVQIRDAKFDRTIQVEKSGSNSTVVWNPWTTQIMADFAVEEHQHMVCVESGNVGKNKLTLAPGTTANLKVVLRSTALG